MAQGCHVEHFPFYSEGSTAITLRSDVGRAALNGYEDQLSLPSFAQRSRTRRSNCGGLAERAPPPEGRASAGESVCLSVRLEPRAESPTALGEASGLLRRPPPDLARPTHVISILSLLRVT